MAILIKHPFVSAKPDGLDSTRVQPSNWNDGHTLTMGPAAVIGRPAGAASAAAQEMPATPLGLSLLSAADIAAALLLLGTNPYSFVPIGSGMDFWGAAVPAGYFFAYGQAISRTTYAAAFAVMGTTFGAGDGSTTFNLPDKRGRVSAGVNNMGGVDSGRLSSFASNTLGTAAGSQTHTLAPSEVPSHNHGYSGTTSGFSNDHTHNVGDYYNPGPNSLGGGGGGSQPLLANTTFAGGVFNRSTGGVSANHTHTFSGATDVRGSDGAHNNIQPTIVCNYIIRVL